MSENIKDKKIAIVLFNLGGPDSLSSVKPFLFNLFSDKYIITLPWPLRYLIAWIISVKREKTAQKLYSFIGNKSPILENTIAQKKELQMVLEEKLDYDFKIFISMRHWHPMANEVVEDIAAYRPTELILLPLYPQFSTTTTASAIDDFRRALTRSKLAYLPVKTICCYSSDPQFIDAHVALIKNATRNKKDYRILFSAHGLPQKIIDAGDPYQWQIENTVSRIVSGLAVSDLDYKITYQSRIGPLEWIGPNTEEEIKLACAEKKSLIIVPIAFVSEHVETLVELDIEYKKIAERGGISYVRIPTVGVDKIFINCLADLAIKFAGLESDIVTPNELRRICPERFTRCICSG